MGRTFYYYDDISILKVGWWGIQTFRLLGPVSRKSRERFGPGNLFCVRHVPIHDQSFNNFENDAIKLSVNKAKLAGLCARNCATIQQVLISNFSFGPVEFLGLSRNGLCTCHSLVPPYFFSFFFASSPKPFFNCEGLSNCCLISLYFSHFPLF